MKAYLALNNKSMKQFLMNSGLFEIGENTNDIYDVMFCDTLKLGEKINCQKKVYLACHYFESLEDLSKYKDYSYFIAFGAQSLFDFLYEKYELEPSKVLQGFVNTNSDISYKNNDDIVVSLMEETYNDESEMYQLSQSLSLNFFKMIKKSKTKVFFNHPLPTPVTTDGRYEWIEDISLDLLENSNIIFTDSILNCRLFFNQDVLKKTILLVDGYHRIKQCLLYDINDSIEPRATERRITEQYTLKHIELIKSLVKHGNLYKKVFHKDIFMEYGIIKYINQNKRTENKKSRKEFEEKKEELKDNSIELDKLIANKNKKKFLLYEQDMEERNFDNYPLTINLLNIISIDELIKNFDKLSAKENKKIIVNDISAEFLEVLEKIKND